MRPIEIRLDALLKQIELSKRMIQLHERKIEFCKSSVDHLTSKQKDQAERLKQAGIHG